MRAHETDGATAHQYITVYIIVNRTKSCSRGSNFSLTLVLLSDFVYLKNLFRDHSGERVLLHSPVAIALVLEICKLPGNPGGGPQGRVS
jgi:hypothetical protein